MVSNKTEKLFVSGPVNTVRLEGKIGNIKKVLYTMFDFHIDIQSQTQCEYIRAKHITSYLVEQFDRVTGSDKMYDFFLEIYPETLTTEPATEITLKYGWAIQELFKKSFVYNPEKSKVVESKIFPNVRFHYIDIRAYIKAEIDKIFFSLGNYIENMYHNKNVTTYDIDNILDSINMSISHLKIIYDLLYGTDSFNKIKKEHMPLIPTTYKSLEKYTTNVVYDINKIIITKIIKEHKYENVKNVINNYVNTDLKEQFYRIFNNLDQLYKYLQAIKKELGKPNTLSIKSKATDNTDYYTYWRDNRSEVNTVSEIHNQFDLISEIEQDIMVNLVDLYFLRRFLNKDYITNATIYTGALHSLFYIYILVKYFDFKVTHASYLGVDISEINNIIKKSPSSFTLSKYFYPTNFNQCSDLTNFPQLFE